jgi:hypothetical protein
MKLQLGGEYARILRAIGQDLESLFPESLQIDVRGKDFIARGYCRSEASTSGATQARSPLGKMWQKLNSPALGVQQKSRQLAKFERVYTPNDINQLDETRRSRRIDISRQDKGCKPELYSLQEKLRIIGRFVDEKHCELVRIACDANTISFEYRDGDGELHDEEHSTLSLYKLQQQYCSKRRCAAGDPWM